MWHYHTSLYRAEPWCCGGGSLCVPPACCQVTTPRCQARSGPVLAGGEAEEANVFLDLHFYDHSLDPLLICNDGSPGGFYYR